MEIARQTSTMALRPRPAVLDPMYKLCVCSCVSVCVCAHVCAWIIHTYAYIYIPTHLPTYIHTYIRNHTHIKHEVIWSYDVILQPIIIFVWVVLYYEGSQAVTSSSVRLFPCQFLRHFHTPLQPFAAFLGGICAQEAASPESLRRGILCLGRRHGTAIFRMMAGSTGVSRP